MTDRGPAMVGAGNEAAVPAEALPPRFAEFLVGVPEAEGIISDLVDSEYARELQQAEAELVCEQDMDRRDRFVGDGHLQDGHVQAGLAELETLAGRVRDGAYARLGAALRLAGQLALSCGSGAVSKIKQLVPGAANAEPSAPRDIVVKFDELGARIPISAYSANDSPKREAHLMSHHVPLKATTWELGNGGPRLYMLRLAGGLSVSWYGGEANTPDAFTFCDHKGVRIAEDFMEAGTALALLQDAAVVSVLEYDYARTRYERGVSDLEAEVTGRLAEAA